MILSLAEIWGWFSNIFISTMSHFFSILPHINFCDIDLNGGLP
jgi:hypothetical protein